MPTPEVMFSHRRFLRAIVRSLVRDEQGAEDIVQETLVRAWQAAPPQGDGQRGSLRGWLGKIARNLSIDHLRGARRLERLEHQVEATGLAPSTEEVLLHEEQRRRLVRAVLALPQPYRDVVLLRFWEELTPAQIAARLGVPGATVRSQLARGLDQLRVRLDREYGDRKSWLAALAPFAAPTAPTAAATSTAFATFLLMNTKFAVSFAALLLVGLLSWLWWRADPALTPATDPLATTQVAAAATGSASKPAAPDAAVEAGTEPEPQRQSAVPQAELTVRGQVLCRNQPFAGPALRLQWFDGYDANGTCTSEVTLQADAKGNFDWHGRRTEQVRTVRVLGADPGLKLWNTPALVTPDAEEVTLEVSVIPLDHELTGRVHDTAGAPIPGARLDVNGWTESQVTADAEGRYRMMVPTDTYPLLVTAPGFCDRLVRGYMPKDAARNELDIELLPGAKIEGHVVDAAGAPVANAEVRGSGTFRKSESDQQGHFVLEGAALGQRHMVTVTRAGFQEGSAMASAGGEPVEVVLQPGLSVEIRALDRDGKPVVGATAKISFDVFSGAKTMGITRLDGRLRLEDLGSRPFDLVVARRGYVSARLEVDPAKVTGELIVDMQQGCELRGRVVDESGAPVIGASIYCELAGEKDISRRSVGSRDSTDEDGRFHVDGLPPEACVVYAFRRDHVRASTDFLGGTTHEVLLRLSPAPAVTGRVVDGKTGAPLAEFTITVSAAKEGQSLHTDPVAFKDDDGYFLVRHWQMVANSELVVEATAPGYAATKVQSVALTAPPRAQSLITMYPGTRVQGVVRDAGDGTAVAGATVALYRWDRRPISNGTCVTDAEGRFVLDNLAVGEHRLRLQREGYPETITEPFTAAADVPLVTLTPTMSRGVALRGRVPDAAGAGGLTVSASGSGTDLQTKVRDDGTFELRGLPAGDTLISVKDQNNRRRYRRIVVGDTDILDFELPLELGTGSVRLEIRGAASGNVQVQPLDDASQERRTPVLWMPFTGSQVVVRGLAPGRYRLSVDTRVYGEEGRTEVEVGAGEVAATVEVTKKQ